MIVEAWRTSMTYWRSSRDSGNRLRAGFRHFAPHSSQAAKQPPSQGAKRPTSHAKHQRAFTLIEILAAFVIFALAFGAVMQALSGSVRNTIQSRDYTQAALMARSKMDALGITEELEPGTYGGDLDEGYRYEMEIREWQPPEGAGEWADGNLQAQVQLYRVDLKVRWGDEPRVRQAEFSTLRATQPDL